MAGEHCSTSHRTSGGVKRSTAPFPCGEPNPWNLCQLAAGCTPAFMGCSQSLRQHCTFAPHLLSKSSYLQPVSSGFDSKILSFFLKLAKDEIKRLRWEVVIRVPRWGVKGPQIPREWVRIGRGTLVSGVSLKRLLKVRVKH